MTLIGARPHGRLYLLRLQGIDTIDTAKSLVGNELCLPASELPPCQPGEFYAYQLEGLDVVTVAGERLGRVESLFPTGSNEVLVVRDGPREHLIPVIADVIRSVDLAGRQVVIEPLEGLLE
jgi:16S rRNA processing protein RimM